MLAEGSKQPSVSYWRRQLYLRLLEVVAVPPKG